MVPAESQHRTSPFGSVMVIIVLLKVALMKAIPRGTFRLIFFFFAMSDIQSQIQLIIHAVTGY